MTTPVSEPQLDGQWIDYYALLGVPETADEDSIRRRIGKLYAEAAANSEHRNPQSRRYFRALVERVLPQCRRVLLDSQWRTRYDQQHALHRDGNESAQNYVEFIAGMRGEGTVGASKRSGNGAGLDESLLPQRAQDEINAARQVVETALSGAALELLPSQAVSQRASRSICAAPAAIESAAKPQNLTPEPPPVASRVAEVNVADAPHDAKRGQTRRPTAAPLPQIAPAVETPRGAFAMQGERVAEAAPPTIEPAPAVNSAPQVAETVAVREQPGEPARAKVITAQEAADIRRRRASNPNARTVRRADFARGRFLQKIAFARCCRSR